MALAEQPQADNALELINARLGVKTFAIQIAQELIEKGQNLIEASDLLERARTWNPTIEELRS